MKKIMILCMVLMLMLTGCGRAEAPEVPVKSTVRNDSSPLKLSFKDTVSVDELRKLDGEKVTINGYLATSSPADGSFIFLMNLPYQSCPFCVPNTSELANTLEVYPKKGETFSFTTQAVKVTGTLDFCKDGNFTDNYGYEFAYKLVDADYTIIRDNADMDRYQRIADSGLIDDLYMMFDYAYLVTGWTEYFCSSFKDETTGEFYEGTYMFPGDVENAVTEMYGIDRYTFYGSLMDKIDSLNADGSLDTVKAVVKDTEALTERGYKALDDEAYTYEEGYFEDIGTEGVKFRLNDGDAFSKDFDAYYSAFCDWINSFEV